MWAARAPPRQAAPATRAAFRRRAPPAPRACAAPRAPRIRHSRFAANENSDEADALKRERAKRSAQLGQGFRRRIRGPRRGKHSSLRKEPRHKSLPHLRGSHFAEIENFSSRPSRTRTITLDSSATHTRASPAARGREADGRAAHVVAAADARPARAGGPHPRARARRLEPQHPAWARSAAEDCVAWLLWYDLLC
jgi:hypothetical protein